MTKAFQANGIDPATAQFTLLNSLTDANRAPVLQGMLQQVASNPSQFNSVFTTLVKEKSMTSSVVTSMEQQGMITATQGKALNSMINNANGKTTTSTGYNYSTYPSSSYGYGSSYGIRPTIKLPTLQKQTWKPQAAILNDAFTGKGTTGFKAPTIGNFTTTAPKMNNAMSEQPFWEQMAAQQKAAAPSPEKNPFANLTPTKNLTVPANTANARGFNGGIAS